MDAHVGNPDEQFVVDMATDAAKGLMFIVTTLVVTIMFLPMFAYGLAVTVWDFAKFKHSPVSECVTEPMTLPQYDSQTVKVNS